LLKEDAVQGIKLFCYSFVCLVHGKLFADLLLFWQEPISLQESGRIFILDHWKPTWCYWCRWFPCL